MKEEKPKWNSEFFEKLNKLFETASFKICTEEVWKAGQFICEIEILYEKTFVSTGKY